MPDSAKPHPNRVLLVDGDVRTSQRLADLLRDDGFDVEVARDGAAAIARLARVPVPDALISELKLSVADGAAVARFGRAQHAGLQVVFVTRDPNLLVAGALTAPPQAILTKPLDYARLLEVLGRPIFPEEHGSLPHRIGGAR
jgi:CheY-like chemotaxis protein